MPDEDADAFAELAEGLRTELHPVGKLESVLVDRIVGLVWRIQRLGRIEAGILVSQRFKVLEGPDDDKDRRPDEVIVTWRSRPGGQEDVGKTNLNPDERTDAQSDLRGYASQEEADLALSGEAFSRDSGGRDALSKLSRYETSMERSLYKALHELQRLQAARQGKEVPVPLAVDIDVSGAEPQVIETAASNQQSDAAD